MLGSLFEGLGKERIDLELLFTWCMEVETLYRLRSVPDDGTDDIRSEAAGGTELGNDRVADGVER